MEPQMTDNAPPLADTNLLVGIDDTDTEAGKGTGSLARGLLTSFDEQRIGAALGATRHQLLLDPAIAYTSATPPGRCPTGSFVSWSPSTRRWTRAAGSPTSKT